MEYEVGADESLSTAVVRAVSAVEGRDPRDLPPLADVLDPAALDILCESGSTDDLKTGARVSFVFSQSRVIIEHGEYLCLGPIRGASNWHSRMAGSRE